MPRTWHPNHKILACWRAFQNQLLQTCECLRQFNINEMRPGEERDIRCQIRSCVSQITTRDPGQALKYLSWRADTRRGDIWGSLSLSSDHASAHVMSDQVTWQQLRALIGEILLHGRKSELFSKVHHIGDRLCSLVLYFDCWIELYGSVASSLFNFENTPLATRYRLSLWIMSTWSWFWICVTSFNLQAYPIL